MSYSVVTVHFEGITRGIWKGDTPGAAGKCARLLAVFYSGPIDSFDIPPAHPHRSEAKKRVEHYLFKFRGQLVEAVETVQK